MIIKQLPLYPVVVLVTLLALFVFSKNYILINLSSSSKLGVYLIQPPTSLHRNDIVAVCLAEPIKSLGLSRNYLMPGKRCDGSAPIVKTLAGLPGDTVVLTENEISINGKLFAYPTYLYDSEHRKLVPWPRGIYSETKGYWLLGENNIKSWDSRYWGEVKRNQIIFKLIPLFVFK